MGEASLQDQEGLGKLVAGPLVRNDWHVEPQGFGTEASLGGL